MGLLLQDLRFAVRRLAKRPGFTLIALLSIAIGIGANTAIFSLVNAIVFRKLPLDRPAELVEIYKATPGFTHGPISFPDLRDLEREGSDVFAGVAAFRLAFVQEDFAGGVEALPAEVVTGNYFPMLGVPALHGRTLLPSDDVVPGGHPVVMVSYGYWQRRYGGDPAVVGREIRLNGRAFTIVGVAPRAFTGSLRGLSPAVYGPRMMVGQLNPGDDNELEARGNQGAFAKARLKPGVSRGQADLALVRLTRSLRDQYPGSWQPDNKFVTVATADIIMNPMLDRVIVPAAILMMAVVGLVLLIACANLASFLLAQAADRRKEVAIRLAMGAERGRLIRQFLTEASALAVVGGGAGILLAAMILGWVEHADLPLPLPIALDLKPDGTVLVFSLILTVMAGLLFGLAPALQATKPDVAPTLKNEGAGGGRPNRYNLRNVLVVVQVAVSLLLLVGSALFLRSFRARLDIDPGFGARPAAVINVQASTALRAEDRGSGFFRSLRQELLALPGVEAVGLTGDLYLSPLNNSQVDVTVPGVDPPPGRPGHPIYSTRVDEGFFNAVGVRIVEGRTFQESDRDGPPVVIVSEAFGRRFWPGRSALGQVFRVDTVQQTVVGVAADAKVNSLGEDLTPFLYRSYEQRPNSGMEVVIRTAGIADGFVAKAVAVVRRLDPEAQIVEAKTLERHLSAMLLPHRLAAWIISAFGALALLLASIGLFGVVSYAVSTRSREVGIRMALGAEPQGVVRLLMGSGLQLVVVGTVIGLGLALVAGRALSGVLYGVQSMDPVAFVVAPVVLILVAVLAAWLPARRAIHLSPVRSLKSD